MTINDNDFNGTDAGSEQHSIFSAADGFLASDDTQAPLSADYSGSQAQAQNQRAGEASYEAPSYREETPYAFDEFVAEQDDEDQAFSARHAGAARSSEDQGLDDGAAAEESGFDSALAHEHILTDDEADVDALFNALPSSARSDDSDSQPHELSRTDRRKRRRKRRKRIITAFLLVCAFLILAASGAWFVKTRYPQLLRGAEEKVAAAQDYPGPGTGSVEFTIRKGESSASVAQHLAKKGIVASADVFMNAVLNANAESRLQPGTFNLKYRMRAADVVAILTDPAKATGMVEVLTNSRVSDVVTQMEQDSKTWSASDVQAVIDSKGAGILPAEANGSFEGWLEPGTYDPQSYATPADMFKAMVDARIKQLDSLKVPTGEQRERILTIASIIGGEVNQPQYYGMVSRVIANRLAKNMPLGMDSIVAYGNDVSPHALTQSMLTSTTNPYNSRIQKGLPPTPIDQPNAEMIQAAMNPTPGNWLYFVTVNLTTGETKFTDNINDFNKYKAEYEQWEKQQQS